ncbi:MAG: 50S ribosomal protein L22 [Oscillospiraceae bacterium]|jgi:large subunit ribosomal protein L22|nr:50S ribosomal protein L22 [Oscillospiraceae bacterium]
MAEKAELKTARAQLNYERIAPRKVQIVCDLIRGKDTRIAAALLNATPKAGAPIVLKLLKSAVANAENNHGLDPERLYVSETYCNPGPLKNMKRMRPRAQGRGFRILKRTSHITVVVAEKE